MDMGTDTRKFYYNTERIVYACIDIKLLPDAYTYPMYIYGAKIYCFDGTRLFSLCDGDMNSFSLLLFGF